MKVPHHQHRAYEAHHSWKDVSQRDFHVAASLTPFVSEQLWEQSLTIHVLYAPVMEVHAKRGFEKLRLELADNVTFRERQDPSVNIKGSSGVILEENA